MFCVRMINSVNRVHTRDTTHALMYTHIQNHSFNHKRKSPTRTQEINDENGPGWIFGVMDESVASVITGTDDLWDELVLDSGSVSTACPYAWCSDISVNDDEKVYLQAIQQRRIPSHGSRVVPLELWGPEARVECEIKFDVVDVAYPVVSLGKMIESGITFSFDDYKCCMQGQPTCGDLSKGSNLCVEK